MTTKRLVMLPLLLCTLVLAAAPAVSWAAAAGGIADAEHRLTAALRLLRTGRPRDSAAALLAIGRAGDGKELELFSEALFKAAQIYDEHLHDLEIACSLYDETTLRFPQSRFAARAERRSRELRVLLQGDAAAVFQNRAVLTELSAIAAAYKTLGIKTVIARLKQLLARSPAMSPMLAEQATYLLGTAYCDAGPEYESAAAETLQNFLAHYPESPLRPHAQQALAELALLRGDLFTARIYFRALLLQKESMWKTAGQKGLAACERARYEKYAVALAWATLFSLFAALAWRGRKHLLRPPPEVLYYLPVAGFLLLMAEVGRDGHRSIRWAMLGLSVGGTLLAWVSGAAAEEHVALRGLLVRAVALLSLLCLVIHYGGLFALLTETWRLGPAAG